MGDERNTTCRCTCKAYGGRCDCAWDATLRERARIVALLRKTAESCSHTALREREHDMLVWVADIIEGKAKVQE